MGPVSHFRSPTPAPARCERDRDQRPEGPLTPRLEKFRAEISFASAMPTHTKKNGALRALPSLKRANISAFGLYERAAGPAPIAIAAVTRHVAHRPGAGAPGSRPAAHSPQRTPRTAYNAPRTTYHAFFWLSGPKTPHPMSSKSSSWVLALARTRCCTLPTATAPHRLPKHVQWMLPVCWSSHMAHGVGARLALRVAKQAVANYSVMRGVCCKTSSLGTFRCVFFAHCCSLDPI